MTRIAGFPRARGLWIAIAVAVVVGAAAVPVEIALTGPCVVLPRCRWSLREVAPGTLESRAVDLAGGTTFHYRLFRFDRDDFVDIDLSDLSSGNGERVWCESGRTVVRIGSSSLDLELAERETALEVARARLTSLRAGDKPEMVDRIRLRLEQARTERAAYAPLFERQRELHEQGLVSAEAWESAQVTQRLRELDVRLAEADLAVATSGAGPEELAAAEAEVVRGEQELATLRGIRASQEIRSPMSGWLGPGRSEGELASVSDADWMVIEALLPQRESRKAARGESLTAVVPGAAPTAVRAAVARIDPRPISTAQGPMIRVYALLEVSERELHEGMQGRARLRCGRTTLARLLWTQVVDGFRREGFLT